MWWIISAIVVVFALYLIACLVIDAFIGEE